MPMRNGCWCGLQSAPDKVLNARGLGSFDNVLSSLCLLFRSLLGGVGLEIYPPDYRDVSERSELRIGIRRLNIQSAQQKRLTKSQDRAHSINTHQSLHIHHTRL